MEMILSSYTHIEIDSTRAQACLHRQGFSQKIQNPSWSLPYQRQLRSLHWQRVVRAEDVHSADHRGEHKEEKMDSHGGQSSLGALPVSCLSVLDRKSVV